MVATRLARRHAGKLTALALLAALGYTGQVAYDGAAGAVSGRYESAKTAVVPRAEKAADTVERAAERAWANVEENPVPVLVALATFVLTVVYHRGKGRSVKDAVAFAVTRSGPAMANPYPPTGARARAEIEVVYQQLLANQESLTKRAEVLPGRIAAARVEAERTRATAKQTQTTADAKRAAAELAERVYADLLTEQGRTEKDLGEVVAELNRMADRV